MTEAIAFMKEIGLANVVSLGLLFYVLGYHMPRIAQMHAAIVQRQSRNLARIEDRQECLEIVLVSRPPDPLAAYKDLLVQRSENRAERERQDPLVPFPKFELNIPFLSAKKTGAA